MTKKNMFLALALMFCFGLKAQFSNALHFDGTNDYVTAPVPTLFSNISSATFTIEFKIKPESFSTNRVFYLQTSNSNYVSVMLNSAGKVYFYSSGVSGLETTNTLPLNAWTHVSVVKTGSSAVVYFNGIAQATTSGGGTSYSTVNMLGIGAKPDGSQYFKGIIDEFRIWSSERTSSEILAHMNTEITLPQTDLAVYYKFNHGIANGSNPTETMLVDVVSGNNGTLNNFALDGTTSNWVGSLQLGLEDVLPNDKGLTIVPNPVSETIFVFGLKNTDEYELVNTVGQIIQNGKISSQKNSIKASHLKPGVYILNVGGESLKFIKQ